MRKIEWDDPDCGEANYRASSIPDLLKGRGIVIADHELVLAQAPRWHKIVVGINSILRAHAIDRFFVTRVWKEQFNRSTSVHVLLPSVYHWPIKDQSSSGSVVTLFDSQGAGWNFDLGIYDKKRVPDRTYLKQYSWNGKVQIFWCLDHCARLDEFYLTKVYGDKVPVRQEALSKAGVQVPVRVLLPQPSP